MPSPLKRWRFTRLCSRLLSITRKLILENARALAAELQKLGLRLVSGGTDNHLILVDLTATGVTGRQAEKALDAAGIVTNKNAIPFDTRPPAVTSGITAGDAGGKHVAASGKKR